MASFPYSSENPLRLGSRGSKMALIQTNMVKTLLQQAHPALAAEGAVEIVVITTTGDAVRDRRLSTVGGKGMFIRELELALEDKRIDAAVHSMKDVPSWLEDKCKISAILERSDPRDVFIGRDVKTLDDLPHGAIVGTSAPRREALTLARRPDLKIVLFRGNADTRLEKLMNGEVDATYLSLSGLERIERFDQDKFTIMDPSLMMPAAGQGAIGIEIMSADTVLDELLQAINHTPSFSAVMAERACLAVLDGSCHSPLAAHAVVENGILSMKALAARHDGSEIIHHTVSGDATTYLALGQESGHAIKAQLPANFFCSPYDENP